MFDHTFETNDNGIFPQITVRALFNQSFDQDELRTLCINETHPNGGVQRKEYAISNKKYAFGGIDEIQDLLTLPFAWNAALPCTSINLGYDQVLDVYVEIYDAGEATAFFYTSKSSYLEIVSSILSRDVRSSAFASTTEEYRDRFFKDGVYNGPAHLPYHFKSFYGIKSLGSLTSIDGNLYTDHDTGIPDLGVLETVTGTMHLSTTAKSLPDTLKYVGHLVLNYCENLRVLPESLSFDRATVAGTALQKWDAEVLITLRESGSDLIPNVGSAWFARDLRRHWNMPLDECVEKYGECVYFHQETILEFRLRGEDLLDEEGDLL